MEINESDSNQNINAMPEVPMQAPAEKMISASEVNEIVRNRVAAAQDKARREALEEAKSQMQHTQSSMGGMNQMSHEDIRQLIHDESQRMANDAHAERIANSFMNKLQSGASKYDDFGPVVADLDLPNNPHIVHWAEGLDNTADVIYELGKNPTKFANVLMLAAKSPNLAQKAMKKISDALQIDEQAASTPKVNEPLSQIKASTVNVDKGKMTVSDMRKMPWLRG